MRIRKLLLYNTDQSIFNYGDNNTQLMLETKLYIFTMLDKIVSSLVDISRVAASEQNMQLREVDKNFSFRGREFKAFST